MPHVYEPYLKILINFIEKTMDVIYVLIPLMIGLGLVGVAVFIWSVRSGQYDDMEGDANRILMDDDDPLLPESDNNNKSEDNKKDS